MNISEACSSQSSPLLSQRIGLPSSSSSSFWDQREVVPLTADSLSFRPPSPLPLSPSQYAFESSVLIFSNQTDLPFSLPPSSVLSSSGSNNSEQPEDADLHMAAPLSSSDTTICASLPSSVPVPNSPDEYATCIPFTKESRFGFSPSDFPPLVPPDEADVPFFSIPKLPFFPPISSSCLARPTIPTPVRSAFDALPVRAIVLQPPVAAILPSLETMSSVSRNNRFRLSPLFKRFYLGARVYYPSTSKNPQLATITEINSNQKIQIQTTKNQTKSFSTDMLTPHFGRVTYVLIYDAERDLHFAATQTEAPNGDLNCTLLDLKNLQKTFPKNQRGDFFSIIPFRTKDQLQGLVPIPCIFKDGDQAEGVSGFGYRLLDDNSV